MNVTLVTVGKTDVPWVKEGLDLYVSRLRHYIPFSVVEIPELKKAGALTQEQIKQKEGELILRLTAPGDRVILLDEHGRSFRSIDFADWLRKQLGSGARGLVFVIGGAYGFSPQVYDRRRKHLPFGHDLLAPDGARDFCRTVVPGVHHPQRRALPP